MSLRSLAVAIGIALMSTVLMVWKMCARTCYKGEGEREGERDGEREEERDGEREGEKGHITRYHGNRNKYISYTTKHTPMLHALPCFAMLCPHKNPK